MHRKVRIAAAAAATLTAGFVFAPHAAASPAGGTAPLGEAGTAASASSVDYTMYTRDDNPGGRVTFETYGDVMQVCDIQADGWSARVRVWDYTANTYQYTLRAGGNGTCDTAKASYGGRYNLREGNRFQVIVDLVKDGSADFGEVAYWWNQN